MSCDLYRFYDVDEKLLYVGISLNAAARAAQHRADKSWWPDVARMDVERLPSREDALIAERAAITSEQPAHNIVHVIRQQASTPDERAVEFEFPYRMAEFFAVQSAVDALGRKFDELARKGHQPVPTRREFIGFVEAIARSVMYGDCCSKCFSICFPIKVEFTSETFCRCFYLCPEGHGPWISGWTRDLNVMAMMP